jgi:hypothetical protein
MRVFISSIQLYDNKNGVLAVFEIFGYRRTYDVYTFLKNKN